MIARLSLLFLCISMPMAVNTETCVGTAGPPCNASLVYSAFRTAYLAALTPNLTQNCVVLVRLENNHDTMITYFKNGTEAFAYNKTYAFTDAPDIVNVTVDVDPGTTYQFHMQYADSEACYVANFETEDIGCRLWVFKNATSEQVTACKEGQAQVCQGTINDTWDEESCGSILNGI
ncbi:uncharacterized protein LOC144145117 [Haemaphysalis longicornis]